MLDARDRLVQPRRMLRLVDLLHQRLLEDVVDEGRLARAGHAGDGDELSERERDVDVLEVVLAGTRNDEFVAVSGPALLGNRDLSRAGEVLTGDGGLALEH